MAYDGKVLARARDRYETEKERRRADFRRQRAEIYARVPRLAQIDAQLRGTVSRTIAAALRSGQDPAAQVAALKEENLALQKERAAQLEQAGYTAQRVLCSSDPDSLDGVIFPQIRACIADGTSPHVIEPRFPGAVEELVNLGDYWDAEQLRVHAEGIRAAALKNSAYHQRCIGFLSAAGSLANDTLRIALECANTDKIAAYASRFAAREFGAGHGRVGRESRCFLSAITPKGFVMCADLIAEQCDRVIVLDDAYGAVSSLILDRLRSYALAAGLDVTACLCPMSAGKLIEHLIIPKLRLCLFTANRFHPAPEAPLRRIHARRFMDEEGMKTHRYRLHFNAKAEAELLAEAIHMLENAKETHDMLEAFYIPAMDFKKVEKRGAQITQALLARAKRMEK